MAEEGYQLDDDSLRRIAKVVRKEERSNKAMPVKRRQRAMSPGTFHTALAKTTSSITARSGTTPGSGTATVWERNASGVLAAVTFTDLVDMTIYNADTAELATGIYAIVDRDRSGDWWVIRTFDLCSTWASIATATPTSSDHVLFVQASGGCLKRGAMGAC